MDLTRIAKLANFQFMFSNVKKYRSAISPHKERFHIYDLDSGDMYQFDTEIDICKYAIKKHKEEIKKLKELINVK